MKIKFETIFAGAISVAIAVGCAAAVAATDGCDDVNNDYITAELALCSTHVYNIGETSNPADDSTRQYMRDVVALKTTVMTQQMYQQYEYLDATLRRLKTQLEKAILTTKFQVAGAATGSGTGDASGGGSSNANNRNIVLSGAYDCIAESDGPDAFDCLKRNMNIARNALNNGGSNGDVKRQLEKDYAAFLSWAGTNWTKQNTTLDDKCNANLSSSKNSLTDCINAFGPAISKAINAWNSSNNRNNNNNNNNGNNNNTIGI